MLKCLLVASSRVTGLGNFLITLPNGGLSSIAANVDRNICDVKILDLVGVRFNAKSYFHKYIKENHFDIIGFSCMVFQYQEMLELAKIAKKMNPEVKTILGGYHATVDYKELLESSDMEYFDVVVQHEGEAAFRRVIDCIHDGSGFDDIPSISFIKDGRVVHNPEADLIDLDELKIPDRDARVLDHKAFRIFGYPGDVVETSRGCTFTCNYCTITKMYGRTFRKFKMERIMQDIQDAKDHGAKAIFFTDDNITINRMHLESLCHAIIDHGLNDLKYITQASVQGFSRNPYLAELARKAGFEWIFLGIESDKDSALEFFSKDDQFQTNETERVVKELRRNGIFVFGGFIMGNPSDDKESLWQVYRYAKGIGVDIPLFFTLTPYPGTELREELLKRNYITNLDDYSRYDCVNANIRTDHLSTYELYRTVDMINHQAFTDDGIYKRLFGRYPMFTTKATLMMMRRHPDMVFHHLTRGRFLEKKREREHLEQIQANGQVQPGPHDQPVVQVDDEVRRVEETSVPK